MPAPFKWTPDRFLAPVTNGGEPEVLGLDNGRLAIAVTQGAGPERFISFHFNSSYVASLNTAMQIASDPDVVYGAPGVAQTSGGEIVVAYGAELTIGGGSLEDVRYLKMHKPGDDAPGFRFANVGVGDGPDQQLHQAVAAGLHDQYAIAWADYVGADTAYMRIYSWRDGALATVAVNTTPGLYAQNVGTTSYRPLAIEGLSNGDYVVAWTGLDFTSRIRVMSASGTPQTPEIPLAGGSTSIWPDITELADGRFVATSFVGGAIHFGIFNADGTTSVADTTFATTVSGSFGQRVSTAALPDGRFVVVWVNAALETRGQMFLPDGTADGAEFAIADVTTGVQTRPSVDA
ncbi:MAG: hypothetical protein JNK46_08070, partial [Methylobacteriaceae bacterium]|nr:hypothetical protein [Methylobacteriaceae bacterium]